MIQGSPIHHKEGEWVRVKERNVTLESGVTVSERETGRCYAAGL